MMAHSYTPIPWSVDGVNRLCVPSQISGSEFVSISMTADQVTMYFINWGAVELANRRASEPIEYAMELRAPRFISFESDHLQNVVEDVYIFDEKDGDLARDFKTFGGRSLYSSSFSGSSSYYVFITPTTGVELFAAAGGVTLLERHSAI